MIVRGAVGVAGIAGTFLSAQFTNRAADKRRMADQAHEDRTRFHKERIGTYSRFIGAFKAYRISWRAQRLPSPGAPRAALADVLAEVLLLATDPVAKAASAVWEAAISTENLEVTDPGFLSGEEAALTALRNFREAARAELFTASG